MMVIAITTAAIAQPIAIHKPPKMIQSTFSNRDKADIGFPQDDETSFETDQPILRVNDLTFRIHPETFGDCLSPLHPHVAGFEVD